MRAHGSRVPGHLTRAVLFDALGTLVGLDEPWNALAHELGERGAPVNAEQARHALWPEMAYYREHHDEAVDGASLEELRERCTLVLRDALPAPARDLPPAELRDALLAALRFRAFADVAPALTRLRDAGCAIAVVSNWDVSLHGVLRDVGLADKVDAVLTSAEERVAKPDPEIFTRALARLGGIPAEAAIHVGDDLHADVAGARAAGIRAVLVDRDGSHASVTDATVVRSLADLPS